jgi:N-acetylglucosamine-6-phosphate deacetylase
MRLGVRAALAGSRWIAGDVAVRDGAVAAMGVAPAGTGGVAAPGFVDLHVNGLGAEDFLSVDPDGYERAARELAATGVVAFQPTFVTAPPAAYRAALPVAARARERLAARGLPRLLGVHLEGPFLSPAWAGAHDPSLMRAPDVTAALELCDSGPVTAMTLAPELPGGLDLVAALVARGIVVSCGHTDADAATAHAAFAAGARAVTHLHNAHRRMRPRDPGVGGVALIRGDVWVQVIGDGVHIAPETCRAAQLAARERFVLVTDAVAVGPGAQLAGRPVAVRDGAARRSDGTLAGSVLTMDQGVRNLVAWGASPAEAIAAATAAPAALLGRDGLGRLAVGAPADLVVLDDDLVVHRTLVAGVEAFAR